MVDEKSDDDHVDDGSDRIGCATVADGAAVTKDADGGVADGADSADGPDGDDGNDVGDGANSADCE